MEILRGARGKNWIERSGRLMMMMIIFAGSLEHEIGREESHRHDPEARLVLPILKTLVLMI